MTVVYIVDDQIINLRILHRFAQAVEENVVVLTFDDPLRALDAFDGAPPDLIVTDYVMPTMDGEAFIRRCRRHPAASDVPIIVVTAYEDREFRYRALDTGASDFLLSPVDGREFCIRARNLLSLRRHQLADRKRAAALEGELETALRRHADEMRRKEEQLRRVVNTVPALISATDREGRIRLLNSQHERYCGVDPSSAEGTTLGDLFGTDYAERHRSIDRTLLEQGELPGAFEESVADASGEKHILLTTKAPLSDGTDVPEGVVTVSLDITERKLQEQAVVESEQRFRSLVEGSVLGILIERDDTPLFANETLARLFGYASVDDILALPTVADLLSPFEHERYRQIRRTVLAGESHGELSEFAAHKRNGEAVWLQAQAQGVSWKGETAIQLTVADVTLRKAYETQLERQAKFDAITGLPNRLLMMDRLRGAIISAERHGHKGAVLFIDLDHFKRINDTLGHASGDEVLKQAAERLTGCVRGEDTVARIGGDEFTVVLPNISSAAHAEPVVQKILQVFSQPFVLKQHDVFVSASIGVSVFPDDGADPELLVKNADVAMYRSKERGRSTFEFFTEALNEQATAQMRIESCLRHALERNEFHLLFQPIFDVRSRRLAGAEAVLCWRSPELDTVAPEQFLACAEETGLLAPIRQWAIDEACRRWSRWRQDGLAIGRLFIDVSGGHRRKPNLPDVVRDALSRYGLSGDCLELEISERSLLREGPDAIEVMRQVGELGVSVAVDEFGAASGSLAQLGNIQASEIKLDRTFFLGAQTNPKQARILDAIVAMAHRLDIRVVANGVDTDALYRFALVTDCDLVQGLKCGGAMPADEFAAWAARQAAARSRT
ncbi:MAG TPA: EAL domain-containing protein, partial [Rhodospirillales bacterium]|nr:EAL domain-containing protein [Rhodospirillales bacterium]